MLYWQVGEIFSLKRLFDARELYFWVQSRSELAEMKVAEKIRKYYVVGCTLGINQSTMRWFSKMIIMGAIFSLRRMLCNDFSLPEIKLWIGSMRDRLLRQFDSNFWLHSKDKLVFHEMIQQNNQVEKNYINVELIKIKVGACATTQVSS